MDKNNQSTFNNRERKEFHLNQTKGYSLEASFSDNGVTASEKQRFQQFYVLSEQRTSDKSGIHPFKVSKRKKDTSLYLVSQCSLATWEGSLVRGVPTSVSQEGRLFFNTDILCF